MPRSIGRRVLHQYALTAIVLVVFLAIDCDDQEPLPPDLGLPKLEIHIADRDLDKVKRKRGEALARGYLDSSGKDYVPASIQYEAQAIQGEIRLKGDWLDHLRGNKWSWRVKLANDEAILGADQFSLQHPRTRYYLHEWVFHQMLEFDGILTPRYEFVELWLNDNYKGIYAFEAHFTETLTARQQYPEGVILKLNEDGFWEAQNHRLRYGEDVAFDLPDFEAATIEPFQKQRVRGDSLLTDAFVAGRQRLESLRQAPDLNAIDIDYWASFLAAVDIAQAYHALRWHNLRWFYHPHNTRLYPIVFDGYAPTGIYKWFRGEFLGQIPPQGKQLTLREEYFIFSLFNHPGFRANYRRYLLEYTNEEYLSAFHQHIGVRLRKLQIAMKAAFPDYEYDYQEFRDHAQQLREAVLVYDFDEAAPFTYQHVRRNKNDECVTRVPLSSISLKAQADPSGKRVSLKNFYCQEIQIEATGPSKNKPLHELTKPITLAAFEFSKEMEEISLPLPEGDRFIFYSIAGVDYWFKEKVNDWPISKLAFIDPWELQIDTSAFQIKGDTITTRSRSITLDQVQVIPANKALFVPEGTTINLNNGAGILAFGTARLWAQENDPIVIDSQDGSGRGIHFLQVYSARIRHVIIRNNKSLQTRGLLLNGALTCYGRHIWLNNLTLENIDAEDALNIIHSNMVKLDTITIKNCTGDGLDIDFSEGELANGTFAQLGGDAIDLSGSTFDLEQFSIDQIADKGISVGEASECSINHCSIAETNIGIAIKDGSKVNIDTTMITNSDYGLAVFTKKAYFSEARATVSNWYMPSGVRQAYVVEKPHLLTIDGELARHTHEAKRLAPIFYPPVE
ncbi:MAG: right-handed parallel beta-helix repeat-containing protein [Bacteroidota bacterium]